VAQQKRAMGHLGRVIYTLLVIWSRRPERMRAATSWIGAMTVVVRERSGSKLGQRRLLEVRAPPSRLIASALIKIIRGQV
jgi:hypothetical protein